MPEIKPREVIHQQNPGQGNSPNTHEKPAAPVKPAVPSQPKEKTPK